MLNGGCVQPSIGMGHANIPHLAHIHYKKRSLERACFLNLKSKKKRQKNCNSKSQSQKKVKSANFRKSKKSICPDPTFFDICSTYFLTFSSCGLRLICLTLFRLLFDVFLTFLDSSNPEPQF